MVTINVTQSRPRKVHEISKWFNSQQAVNNSNYAADEYRNNGERTERVINRKYTWQDHALLAAREFGVFSVVACSENKLPVSIQSGQCWGESNSGYSA